MAAAAPFPFQLLQCPRLRLRLPTVRRPSQRTVLVALFALYFFVTAGIFYDMINAPPSMGQVIDQRTGKPKPQAVMPRLNGQYIMEGFTAAFLFTLGSVGVVLLDRSSDARSSGKTRQWLAVAAFVCVLLAYNGLMVFLRTKMPGYLR